MADLAISNVKVPHNGKYRRVKVATSRLYSTAWADDGVPTGETTLHFEIQREGGPYAVLRMSRSYALLVAEQMIELARMMPETAADKQGTIYQLPE